MKILLNLTVFLLLTSCSKEHSKSIEYKEVPVPIPSAPTSLTIEKEGSGIIYIKEGTELIKECMETSCVVPITDKILTIQAQADYNSQFHSWTESCSFFTTVCYVFPSTINQKVKITFSKKWNQINGGEFNYHDIDFLEHISDTELIIWSPSIFVDNQKKVSLGKDSSDNSNSIFLINPKTNKIILEKEVLANKEIVKIKKILNKYYIIARGTSDEIYVSSNLFEDFTQIGHFIKRGNLENESNINDLDLHENTIFMISNQYLYWKNIDNNNEGFLNIGDTYYSSPKIWISDTLLYLYRNQEKTQIFDLHFQRQTNLENDLQPGECGNKSLTYSNEDTLYFLCENKLTKINKQNEIEIITLQNYHFTKNAKHGFRSMVNGHFTSNSRVLSVWEKGGNIYISKKSKNLITGDETSIIKFSSEGILDDSFPKIDLYPSYPIDYFNIEENKLTIVGSFKFINDTPSGLISHHDLLTNETITYSSNRHNGIVTQYNPTAEPINLSTYEIWRGSDYLLVTGNFNYYNDQKVPSIMSLNLDGTRNTNFNLSEITGLGYEYYIDTYFDPIVTNSHIIIRFVKMNHNRNRDFFNYPIEDYIYKVFTTSGSETSFPLGLNFQRNHRIIRIENNSECYFYQQEPNYIYEYYCGIYKQPFNLNLSLSGLSNPYIHQFIPSNSGYFLIIQHQGIYQITHINFNGQEDRKSMISLPTFVNASSEKIIYASSTFRVAKENSSPESSILLAGHFYQNPRLCNFLILKDIADFSVEFPRYCSLNYPLEKSSLSLLSGNTYYQEWKGNMQMITINDKIYLTGSGFVSSSDSYKHIHNILSFEPISGSLNSLFDHKYIKRLQNDYFAKKDFYNYFTDIIQIGNQLYISGQFDNYGGIPLSGIIRLNLDGTLAD